MSQIGAQRPILCFFLNHYIYTYLFLNTNINKTEATIIINAAPITAPIIVIISEDLSSLKETAGLYSVVGVNIVLERILLPVVVVI